MKILHVKSNIKNKPLNLNSNFKGKNKYFIPSNNLWFNSLYFYNKDFYKTHPLLDNIVLKYIKVYFNMYDTYSERSAKLYRLTKRKRLFSSRKVWVGDVQIKHTNNKVIINTYIYDRVNNIVIRKLNFHIHKNRRILTNFINRYNANSILSIINNIKNEIIKLPIINTTSSLNLIKSKFKFLDKFINEKENSRDKILNKKYLFISNKVINQFNNKLVNLTNLLLKNLLINKRLFFSTEIWKHSRIILDSYKFILLNTLKYKNIFVVSLVKLLSKIYGNKDVTLNIVFLKNYYYNSSILSEIVAHKGKNRKTNIKKTFISALADIEVPKLTRSFINKVTKKKNSQYLPIKNSLKFDTCYSDNIIRDNFSMQFINLKNRTFNLLGNKSIAGIRLEASGRLTKRFTAERAVKKLRYIGTLKNIDSSLKGLSTQMVRNNINSNIQYSRVRSGNRIGSFGVKGWIGSV